MRHGLAMAVAFLLPTIVFTGALFSSLALATPRDAETDTKPDPYADLVRSLSAKALEEGAEERRQQLEQRKGKLRPPVHGTLVRRFGEKDSEGRPSNGIILRTEPGAQVVAPFESTILFANPYKGHGQLLILGAAGGYHFVLTGMTKIYGVESQKLLEGEPVGIMPASSMDSPGVPGAGPELYFEIRKDGSAINPLPWLATARLERTSK